MRVTRMSIPEVVLFEPTVHRDDRGYFLETYRRDRYAEAGVPHDFVQDNRSRSTKGVLRGLHAQRARPQGKLVQCVQGKIFDVAVDLRRGSPTFLRWVGATLTGDAANQLWVPPGFAHGFCVLSSTATVEYKCTAPYDPTDEMRIAWGCRAAIFIIIERQIKLAAFARGFGFIISRAQRVAQFIIARRNHFAVAMAAIILQRHGSGIRPAFVQAIHGVLCLYGNQFRFQITRIGQFACKRYCRKIIRQTQLRDLEIHAQLITPSAGIVRPMLQ
ncbi:dTDP-4-dehydrorhamnose 3,5-epimerase [candidate division KSB1 bacterium]|nr:dTDP-4-dehydrorhamnose 3,5-epimerase [candidate division KSB1 bacterium]